MHASATPRRIAAAFTAVVLISLLLGLLAIWRIMAISRNATTLATNSVPSVVALNRVVQSNFAALRAVRVMTLAGTPPGGAAEAAYLAAKAMGDAACREYEGLLSDGEDARLFETAREKRELLFRRLDAVVVRLADGKPEEARGSLIADVDPASEATVDAFNDDVAYNVKLAEAEYRAARDNAAWSLGLIGGGVAVATLVSGLIGGLAVQATRRALDSIGAMIREGVARTNRAIGSIAGSIQTNADQTAVSAAQLSAASRALAHGCSEQTASVTETSASLEEMSAMIRSTAENAAKAKEFATQARAAAETGRRTMAEMDTAMRSIEASGLEVAKIVKNIDEIAFQTNILALNAAVEAARAGESGAGFAVVADEVRALAQRSAAAAKETATKIDAALASTKRGAACCNGVGESLAQILEKVASADVLAAEIAVAAREQSQGIQQINAAMGQIDKVTQSNATGAEQTSSATEELRGQAGFLRDSVEQLRKVMADAERGAVLEPTAGEQPAPRPAVAIGGGPTGFGPDLHDDGSFRAF